MQLARLKVDFACEAEADCSKKRVLGHAEKDSLEVTWEEPACMEGSDLRRAVRKVPCCGRWSVAAKQRRGREACP